MQLFEFDFNVQSDNGTLDHHSGLIQWSSLYRNALKSSESAIGCKDPDIAANNNRMRDHLVAVGLTSIRERHIRVPLSGWRNGKVDTLPFRSNLRDAFPFSMRQLRKLIEAIDSRSSMGQNRSSYEGKYGRVDGICRLATDHTATGSWTTCLPRGIW